MKNLSITSKLVLIVSCFVISIVLLGGVFAGIYFKVNQAVESAKETQSIVNALNEFKGVITESQLQVMVLVNQLAENMDTKILKEGADAAKQTLTREASLYLDKLRGKIPQEDFVKMAKMLEDYRTTSLEVIKSVEIKDIFMSNMFTNDARARYGNISAFINAQFQTYNAANVAQQENISNTLRIAVIAFAAIFVLALVVAVLAIFASQRYVGKPIVVLAGVLHEISQGNLNVDVPLKDAGGEIGRMAK